MKNRIASRIMIVALATAASLAHAGQPPDTVTSDVDLDTAMGTNALKNLDVTDGGAGNTAAGDGALFSNTTGDSNTAVGAQPLYYNTTGNSNTAISPSALYFNTTGSYNIAIGGYALENNTEGFYNVAIGPNALSGNTTGGSNTAVGYNAMGYGFLSGANNTAYGAYALASTTSGKGNAAQGVNALFSNTSGIRNLGIGSNALYTNTTGGYNIALGFDAGYNVTTGSNNIEIGTSGAAADNNTIQIGVQETQTVTKIAGIYGTAVTGSAVYVNSAGQLGVQASSERFKTGIATMPDLSAKLAELRPVTFHYKTDANGTLQYGLIAEEVAQVYPDLVVRGANGRIDGVRYEELAPMLLNAVQQQQHQIAAQDAKIAKLEQMNESIQAAMAELLAKNQQVAMR